MTRDEMKAILTPVLMNYRKAWEEYNLTDLVNFWYGAFGECEYDIVKKAFDAHMAVNRYAPTIADINDQIHKMTEPEYMTETEAFSQLWKAIQNSAWHSEEEFKKLDPVIQKVVGDAHQLKEWAISETDEVLNIVQPHFMRSYNAEVERQKDYSKLPKDVRRLIDNVNKPALYEGRLLSDEAVNG